MFPPAAWHPAHDFVKFSAEVSASAGGAKDPSIRAAAAAEETSTPSTGLATLLAVLP
eukprot:CAMPEP_0197592434 /NCGR_PEP_ID=MMETSP1326-20131121/15091_1 /TAXON_ID=1155430 /ORGANISM="Genus nov. species nov., Strain RCC2288" /LENGTH=56 /DNA_ID=CAMNT_0043158131 /DNA_START=316 /DNA_END=486 /DNA_ORIENTATION=+